MICISVLPAVGFFLTLVWFAMWWILIHNITCSWFILVLNTPETAWTRPAGFLNTAEICHLPFCQGNDQELINNGQAANNRRPVLQHFRGHSRLMTQCCMHATTATNVPASKALNTYFLSVQQQNDVLQGASDMAPWRDLFNYEYNRGCCQIKAMLLSVLEFCSFSLPSCIKDGLF